MWSEHIIQERIDGMKNNEIIKKIMKKKKVSIQRLISKLDITYQTFNNKISRDKFTLQSLKILAEQLGYQMLIHMIDANNIDIYDNEVDFHQNIKKILANRGQTESDFADTLHISRQSLSQLLTTGNFTPEAVHKYATALNCSLYIEYTSTDDTYSTLDHTYISKNDVMNAIKQFEKKQGTVYEDTTLDNLCNYVAHYLDQLVEGKM